MSDRQSAMPGYCERHDLRYDSLGCPVCVIDKFDDPRRPISAEEEAVVEAAKALTPKPGEIVWVSGGPEGDLIVDEAKLKALWEAVSSLTSPKAVRPEEVEPGTRFRFAPNPVRTSYQLANIYTRVEVNAAGKGGDWPGWLTEEGRIATFAPQDRIIPIPEED